MKTIIAGQAMGNDNDSTPADSKLKYVKTGILTFTKPGRCFMVNGMTDHTNPHS
ncbi:hypothetical protein JCM14469_06160 [Desulfatiferula olefinivorans]